MYAPLIDMLSSYPFTQVFRGLPWICSTFAMPLSRRSSLENPGLKTLNACLKGEDGKESLLYSIKVKA